MTEPKDDTAEEFQSLRTNRTPQVVSGMDRPYKPKPLGEQTRALRRQGIMVIFGNLGVMSTGMGLGLPTITNGPMKDPTAPVYLSDAQFSWFASLNLFAAPLGGLLSGVLLDKLGRKNTMYTMNILGLISWILMAFASQEDQNSMFIQLMVSRFFVGLASGLSSAPVGVYSAEISTPKIRGRLILGTSISVAAGITMIYILGYFIRDDWHLTAMICCAFQIVALICVIPMPESPNWLLTKNRLPEARQSLNYFRGLDKKNVITHPEVLAEFNVLQKNIQLAEGEKKPPFTKSLKLPEVYKPLLILMGLFTFQQVTGIFVIIVYAVQIAMEAGVTIDPFMCAIMIGVARVVTTCPMGYILEKWGRRRSGLISALGMGVCMVLLALHKYLKDIPYLPVIAIVSFIVLSTLGLYTLPFFMISEVFPQKVRGPASGLTVAYGTFVSFICTKTYPSMKAAIGNEYCFVIYGIMSFLGAVFIYAFLPETRGRTLLEIEEQFRSGKSSKLVDPVEMQEIMVK
ncbi:facilitated trehalose transporter Tret1-2 homolog [Haematobia irritans]|uniref:facilitated trehalose transporter Tret1-2 homolog n=1 Tax=Haematobia irritans TaxID=7368 RepID=UPI003F4FFB3F